MPKDTALFLTQHIRSLEQRAVNELGLSEDDLMQRAGTSAYTTLRKHFNQVHALAVFCGGGNNGGDGYELARLAHEDGLSVIVYQNKSIEKLPPTAQRAAQMALDSGVVFQNYEDAFDSDAELIVDALLGIGLEGVVKEPVKHVIEMINDSKLPVFAVDIPSGLHADTGDELGACVKADITMTFIAEKIGMYTKDGPDFCGEVILDSLGLDGLRKPIEPAARLLDKQILQQVIAPRKKNSHKGSYGHVLVIGGGKGMPGAPILTAMAALRLGAGRVTIATHPMYAQQAVAGLPEAMIIGIDNADALEALLAQATVCVIGPGLGEDERAHQLFATSITSQLPLVIDASALHLLSENKQHDDNWILTPHPGEAGQLLNQKTSSIQANRLQAVKDIQLQYGGTVVLKGNGTIISNGGQDVFVCSAGNPGMATAGMGDVLSGVIGALIAQGVPMEHAAKLGVWLHAKAGDDAAASYGERGMLATDLMPFLRKRINSVA